MGDLLVRCAIHYKEYNIRAHRKELVSYEIIDRTLVISDVGSADGPLN